MSRHEPHRPDLVAGIDKYLEELIAEIGMPSDEEMARAAELGQRIEDHLRATGGL